MAHDELRVLQVIGAMDRGGAETLIMNLYRKIDRSRVQFDFLVNENRECDYDDEIASLGGRIFRIPRYRVFNELEYKKACNRFFLDHAYSIVHGHIGLPASIYLKEASRAGAFTIVHSHSQNFPLSPEEIVFRACSHRVRGIADYYLGCSVEAGRDRFGSAIVEGNSFHVLNNGVDARAFQFNTVSRERIRAELKIEDDAPVFGHVGRLTDVKNHKFLFEVFDLVKRQMPKAQLLLLGRGELEEHLRSEVKELGLERSVSFLGVRNDVAAVLSAMDVFIFPSFSEGLPCAVVEAQDSGLPVILSTGVPPAAEILPSTKRIDLSQGSSYWAKLAVSMYKEADLSKRQAAINDLVDKGFDIGESARWIQNFYLHHSKGNGIHKLDY